MNAHNVVCVYVFVCNCNWLVFIGIQWTLRITDTLVHRLLSFIRGMSFIGVFYFSHPPLHLILIIFIANNS